MLGMSRIEAIAGGSLKQCGLLISCFLAGLLLPIGCTAATAEKKKAEINDRTVTVLAAGAGGTYLAFAEDIQNVLDDSNGESLRVIPMVGRGGVQNLVDLLFHRGIDIAITQQEQLMYLKKQNPVLYSNIEKRIYYITKLYDSEFHILCNKNIKNIKELEGKKVSLSKRLSATDIAGRIVFSSIGVRPIFVNEDVNSAIQEIKKGQIAAVAYFAGSPIAAFAQLPAGGEMHFLSVDEKTLGPAAYAKLLETFSPGRLDAKSYPLLIAKDEAVTTLSSSTVLAAYAWPPEGEQYQKIEIFVNSFFENFTRFLEPPHHPKWREVNIEANVSGWTRLRAAQDWLDHHKNELAEMDRMRMAFHQFLDLYGPGGAGLPISLDNERELWSHFHVWFTAQKTASARR
jgi:TRAP transporter TAXI family solute receptor